MTKIDDYIELKRQRREATDKKTIKELNEKIRLLRINSTEAQITIGS